MARKIEVNKKLTDDTVLARSLGLTYGQYIGYKETGYLEDYKRYVFHDQVEREQAKTVTVTDEMFFVKE